MGKFPVFNLKHSMNIPRHRIDSPIAEGYNTHKGADLTMTDARRRRLSWLFALVLLAELALLCCASAQIASHCCPEHGRCAICECLRAEGRQLRLALPAAFLVLLVACAASLLPSARSLPFTLFSLRVRMND